MEMCICGHLEREHDPTGECRAAGCRCKHFKPEIRLPSSAAGLANTDAPTAPPVRGKARRSQEGLVSPFQIRT